MSDIVERRTPVAMYLYPGPNGDHKPLDAEGLRWLADQLCSEERVHPDRTMASGWILSQAAFELPHLVDEIERLRKERDGLQQVLFYFRYERACHPDIKEETHDQLTQTKWRGSQRG